MSDWLDEALGNEILPTEASIAQAAEALPEFGMIRRTGNQYSTAVTCTHPRQPQRCVALLEQESVASGEKFFYGWGAGKDKILGPSVHLATAAARLWMNNAVVAEPIQELPDSWIMPTTFVDLETGFTITRSFRQSKKWTIFGKHDAERKDDMRFQIGQSKSARNVILNALPAYMIDKAMKAAQNGVRVRIEAFIKKNGIQVAVKHCIESLARHGIDELRVLNKTGRADLSGLTAEDVIMLRGDIYALDEGQETADLLFPDPLAQKHPISSEPVGTTSFVGNFPESIDDVDGKQDGNQSGTLDDSDSDANTAPGQTNLGFEESEGEDDVNQDGNQDGNQPENDEEAKKPARRSRKKS